MRIENTEIAFLDRSKKEAGLAHGKYEIPKSLYNLSHAKHGSGHDNWLSGIIVAATVTATQGWWLQWMRYHYNYIVSSTSKMHSIMDMPLEFSPNVTQETIALFTKLRDDAKSILDGTPALKNAAIMSLANNVPTGLCLTAGIRTNYLQLKNQYRQRHTHKSEEWCQYCRWMEDELREFKELVL